MSEQAYPAAGSGGYSGFHTLLTIISEVHTIVPNPCILFIRPGLPPLKWVLLIDKQNGSSPYTYGTVAVRMDHFSCCCYANTTKSGYHFLYRTIVIEEKIIYPCCTVFVEGG